ncbi:hypothetical protein E2C01_051103 [Portunus trituberculatus]|uniref:Uncharacterized protein n=1 Tax=Portunus trituberculatus TaxID=210409 RepID=A0A5B7GHT0_PORTR|nr:hypothetical protein [Portunus trituberculatus]
MRRNQFKIAHVKIQLEICRCFMSVRGIALWNSLPDDLVAIQALPSFKVNLSKH